MADFNLTTIRPSGFLHVSAFDDVKSSLAWSLTALGHTVVLNENALTPAAHVTNIVFGCEVLDSRATLPPNAIVFNMEQPLHPRMEAVRAHARGHRVWDIYRSNVADWQSRGYNARHVEIGYTPNLTRIPRAPTQDIDVCFLGWLTARRRHVIDQLRAAGLNVYASDCCYGGARDQILSRSKVVLNLHHDDRTLFEIVRVSFLLANSKCVVAEASTDDEDYAWLGEGIIRLRYEKLVEWCREFVEDSELRYVRETKGFDAIRSSDFTRTVERLLDEHRGGHKTRDIMAVTDRDRIVARYKRGCDEGDMAAFLPWLRDHAHGNILEIGTRDGASTSALLLGIEAYGGHLNSIDIEDCSHLWSHPQWTFTRINSLEVRFPDASFDLILIDGDHAREFYIGDLYNAYHWVKPGGMILSHDIRPERGHEFYSVALREEFYKFARLHPELTVYELEGKYGMGVMVKPAVTNATEAAA